MSVPTPAPALKTRTISRRFAFNGTLNKVTIKLEPAQMSIEEKKAVQDKNGRRD